MRRVALAPEKRGFTTSRVVKTPRVLAYNFGCFYVRVGRDDEALFRLRHAFELDPSLKETASKDPDLDRVRNHRELVELLVP